MPNQFTRVPRSCRVCGATMMVRPAVIARGGGVYCSRACTARRGRVEVERVCEGCGQRFVVEPYRVRLGAGRFCSKRCANRHSNPPGAGSTRWRGGRILDTKGYVFVHRPGHPLAQSRGYVAEHRLVLHEAGVDIPPGHVVHHVNGVKGDNRPENLQVLSVADHNRLTTSVPRPTRRKRTEQERSHGEASK